MTDHSMEELERNLLDSKSKPGIFVALRFMLHVGTSLRAEAKTITVLEFSVVAPCFRLCATLY